MIDAVQLMEQWSGDIHPRLFDNVKDNIGISDIRRYLVGYIHIHTWIEAKNTYPLIKRINEKTHNELHAVVESEKQIDCPECHGAGFLPCVICASKGYTTCLTCIGIGKSMCHSCKGSGVDLCDQCQGKGVILSERTREWFTEDGKKHHKTVFDEVSCLSCGGKGNIPCAFCDDGSIPCPHCDGKGNQLCDVCCGEGKKLCNLCSGDQKVTRLILNEYKKIEDQESLILETPEFIRKFSVYNITHALPEHHFGDISEPGPLDPLKYQALLTGDFISQYDFTKRARRFLETVQTIGPSESIKNQRATFDLIEYIEISYTYEGAPYTVLARPSDNTFYYADNPFITILKETLEKAEQAYKSRELDEAEALASKSQMNYAGTTEENISRQLLTKIKKAKNKQIVIGAVLSLQTVLLIKFISLISYGQLFSDIIIPLGFITLLYFGLNRIQPNLPVKHKLHRLLLGYLTLLLIVLIIQLIK